MELVGICEERAQLEAAEAIKKYEHAQNALTVMETGHYTLKEDYLGLEHRKAYDRVMEILREKAQQEDNKIRSNWHGTFIKYAEDVTEISPLIDYGFSDQDLFTFCCYYKCDICRKEIDALLEDCNYHEYGRMLEAQQYDKYLKAVVHEYIEPREEKPLF